MMNLFEKIGLMAIAIIMFAACNVGGDKKAEKAKVQDNEISIENENSSAFYKNLQLLCGKSFSGREVFVKEGRESWADKPFTMHVTLCDDEQIHIPFHVGENTSRTWMFLNEGGKLRFRHDHRHPDGTPEDLTLYGGYATQSGTPFHQEFPADEYTIDVHPRSEGAVWIVSLSTDMTCFCYQLFHHGELLFQAEFDLTVEI